MNTEAVCSQALEAVRNLLTEKEYCDCHDYINRYGEWLLGLEFAVDYLCEEDKKIPAESYELFLIAFKEMGQNRNSRLGDLKAQVSAEC